MHELGKEVFGDDEGSHATASEVAVTQVRFAGDDQGGFA